MQDWLLLNEEAMSAHTIIPSNWVSPGEKFPAMKMYICGTKGMDSCWQTIKITSHPAEFVSAFQNLPLSTWLLHPMDAFSHPTSLSFSSFLFVCPGCYPVGLTWQQQQSFSFLICFTCSFPL